jgi:putative glutamine amidotransferase
MTMGVQERKGHPYQVMTHKYITPLVEIAGCVPVLVPTCCGIGDLDAYLDMADGVYLTGAGSNIDPALYGQENLTPEKTQDPDRDRVDIALIRAALDRGLPVFAICRGMQEVNVALGGNIHQKLYAVPGKQDHREDPEAPVAIQYGDSHGVDVVKGSWLATALGRGDIRVNSLHGQGIDRLAPGLEVLGTAPDGVIEAFHAPSLSPFLVGVQWHPEWQAAQNPVSVTLFDAFGQACRRFKAGA